MRDLKMEKLCSQKKWDKIYDYISNKVCALTQEEQAELFLQWSGCSIPQRILCDAPDITTFLPFLQGDAASKIRIGHLRYERGWEACPLPRGKISPPPHRQY